MSRDFDSVLIEYAKAGKKPVYCTIGDGERIPVPLEYASDVKSFSSLLFQKEQKIQEYRKRNAAQSNKPLRMWSCKVGEFSVPVPYEDALNNVPISESVQKLKKEALRRYAQAVSLARTLQKEYPEDHIQVTLDPQKLKKMARKHQVHGLREVTKALSKTFRVPPMKAARAVVSQKGGLTQAAAYFLGSKVKRVSSKSQSKKLISDKALRRLRTAALQALVLGTTFAGTWKLASLTKDKEKKHNVVAQVVVPNQPKEKTDTSTVAFQPSQLSDVETETAARHAGKMGDKSGIPAVKKTKPIGAVPSKTSAGLVPKTANGAYAQNLQMAIDCHDEMVCFFAIYEGFRAEAYRCSAGYPTIGYGMRWVSGRKVKMGDRTNKEKAAVDLTKFFDTYIFPRLQDVPRVLTKSELGTFTMFSGNLGPNAAVRSDFFKNFGSDSPDYDIMAAQLGRHCRYKDKTGIYRQSEGLKDRRAFEAYLLKSGDDIGYFLTLSPKMVGRVRKHLKTHDNLDYFVASSVEKSVLSRLPDELQRHLVDKYDICVGADGKLVSNNPSGLTLAEKQQRRKGNLIAENLSNTPFPNQSFALDTKQEKLALRSSAKNNSR